MKNPTISRLLLLLIVSATVSNCKTTSTSLQVLRPADVTVPEHIQKIAIVNRTRPSQDEKTLNVIEGIFSGEGIGSDKQGAEECLFGLRTALTRTPRYEVVQPAGLDLRGTGTATFPAPMSWADVKKICEENKTDAVIALEAFDSDARTLKDTRPVTITNKDGSKTTVPEYIATLQMRFTCGWRIYDLKNEKMIDEHRSEDQVAFDNKGGTPQQADAGLPWKRDAVKKTGGRMGDLYSYRISPMWITVSRMYYRSGNDQMQEAASIVKRNRDWKAAGTIWKKESTNADAKVAGRACYNMAVASEVDGQLEIALEWANKAYKDYGNKQALQYVSILNQRVYDKNRLKDQMK